MARALDLSQPTVQTGLADFGSTLRLFFAALCGAAAFHGGRPANPGTPPPPAFRAAGCAEGLAGVEDSAALALSGPAGGGLRSPEAAKTLRDSASPPARNTAGGVARSALVFRG